MASNVFNEAPNATPEEKEAEANAENRLFEWRLKGLRVFADKCWERDRHFGI